MNTLSHSWLLGVIVFLTMFVIFVAAWFIKNRQINKQSHNELSIEEFMAQSRHGVWLADDDFNIYAINQGFIDITGFDKSYVINKKAKIATENGYNERLEKHIAYESKKHNYWSGEFWTVFADKKKYALNLTVTKLIQKNTHTTKTTYIGMFNDITNKKKNELAIKELSTRDKVTGLANRSFFLESLNHAISSCNETYPNFLLLLIDLDNFSKINDLISHQCGDALLKEITLRLQTVLNKGFTLARLSSDEFAVLVPPMLYTKGDLFFANVLVKKILSVINQPFTYQEIETNVSASCGLAIYPNDATNSAHLLRCADTALNDAKKSAKNQFKFFDDKKHNLNPDELFKESAILKAIEDEQFELYFQPKYNAKNRQLVGFEGLVRWPTPDGNIIPPNEFIPFSEETGAIIPLTNNLLAQACKQIKKWQSLAKFDIKLAVNISAKHFQDNSLIETLTLCLHEYGIPPEYIELEITESAMMENPEVALTLMQRIKALGVTIALDDFGTGHSSLGYLKRFPIDVLKIDRSFIIDIEHSEQDRNITATIIKLAQHFNLQVVAEGVESAEQAELLNAMDCHILQGFYFSKPLPKQMATELLESELDI